MRGPIGLNRGTGTSSTVIAPPRQRRVRCALPSARLRFRSLLRATCAGVPCDHGPWWWSQSRPDEYRSRASECVGVARGQSDWAAVARGGAIPFLSGGQIAQAILPFGFQAASNQPVFRLHGPIPAFGSFGLITQPVPLPTAIATEPHRDWLGAVGPRAWCFDRSRSDGFQKSIGYGLLDGQAADVRQYCPRPSTMSLPAQW